MTTIRPMYRFQTRRSAVHSIKGMISSSQPLASAAGVEILQQGGNAADAAVAVAAALNVTEPCSTGIGGDLFCLYFDAKTKKVRALNGSGRSPAALDLKALREKLGSQAGPRIPITSVHAVTVPGAAAGWVDTVEKFGSGKLSLKQILAPAIRLAEDGFPVSAVSAYWWKIGEPKLKTRSPNGFEMLKQDAKAPGGYRSPEAGELMKNPTLANTFRVLAEEGKEGFYKGRIAEAVIKATSSLGGALTLDDLKHHLDVGTEETIPISLKFAAMGANAERGGLEIWEHSPNGQGIIALIALGILQELEKTGKIQKWSSEEHNTVSHLHACVEALRLAFADANWWVTDPNVERVPTTGLLSHEYLSERAALFSPTSALPASLGHGSPAHTSSDTVYFSVTDAEGNGASFINSNFGGFGTDIVPPGCGFTLQNRGANFNLEEGHPNTYAPRKRPYHTIIPALATNLDDDSLASVFGVMGGFMQPQGHVQVIWNQYVFGMDPQEALDAPRFCIGGGMPNADGTVNNTVISIEEGIAQEVVDGLRDLGHTVEVVTGHERALFGRGQIIRVKDEEGIHVYTGGSDPRADGAAVPLV